MTETPPTPPPEPVVSAESLVQQAAALPVTPPPTPPEVAKLPNKICQNEKCKAENPPNNVFCGKCGKALPGTEAEKPICLDPKCNTVNPKGSKNCCMCGKSLTDTREFTKNEIKDLIIDGVIMSLIVQFALIMQMWVLSNFQTFDVSSLWYAVAFSIIPTITLTIRKKRGQSNSDALKQIEEENMRLREQRIKDAEDRLTQKEKMDETTKIVETKK
jgi:ribosomal protein L40E